MNADPDERHNLYHVPDYQHTVNQCRRLLLEWLIRTRRVRTSQPAVKTDVTGEHEKQFQIGGGSGRYEYPLAGDGTAPNSIQPRFAEKSRSPNYI